MAMANSHDPDYLLWFGDPIHDDVSRSTKHDHVHLSVRLEKVQKGIELAIEQTR